MKFIFSILVLTLSLSTYSADNSPVDELVKESKNDLMIVAGGGLAGAILGLSTLSFVDEPKKHTKNILTGAAIGIIAGVIYVAYTQAYETKQSVYSRIDARDFDTYSREAWHSEEFAKLDSDLRKHKIVNYSFSY